MHMGASQIGLFRKPFKTSSATSGDSLCERSVCERTGSVHRVSASSSSHKDLEALCLGTLQISEQKSVTANLIGFLKGIDFLQVL